MIYSIHLINEDSGVSLIVEADSLEQAIEKAKTEYPGRELERADTLNFYDAVIK